MDNSERIERIHRVQDDFEAVLLKMGRDIEDVHQILMQINGNTNHLPYVETQLEKMSREVIRLIEMYEKYTSSPDGSYVDGALAVLYHLRTELGIHGT